jgi:L-aspartate oxidase
VTALRESGLDPARELVPVAPAAHYMMGGVATDVHARSTVAGLYAVGETSGSGLHGANRLASNSLSECFVFARRAIAHVVGASRSEPARSPAPSEDELRALAATGPAPAERATREALWRDAGIARDEEGLSRLLDDPHPLARMIARNALARTESRGAHGRVDHPEQDAAFDHRHAVCGGDEAIAWQEWT